MQVLKTCLISMGGPALYSRRNLLLVLTVLSVACASRRAGEPVQPGFNLFSKEQDIQLGREAAAQIQRQVQIVDNPEAQNYIRTIGQRLASTPEAAGYPYTFVVVNDPSINAFALPGGPIFVHSGLIAAADNEAQLAGVLAHEIAHVALRHATNQASKANIIQLPAVLAGAAIGQGSILGQLGQIGLGLGVNSLLLKYSRSAETQADTLGVQIVAKVGYNPIEMARFFEKLEAEGGSRAPEFLSSHPSPGNRMKNVQREIQALPKREYIADTPAFRQVKQTVARLSPPKRDQPVRSVSAPPPPPSTSGFQTLQAERFSIAYPNGWEVFGDNNSGSITIAPRQGLVQNQGGGVDIGYGAILSWYFPATTGSVDQATRELVSHLRGANPSMQTAGSQRRLRVGGSPGMITPLTSVSPYGGVEVDYLLTVMRPEGLFYMVFINPEQAWPQLKPVFDQMAQSLGFR